MQPELEIRQATIADLATIASLFDAYRQFYRQPSDVEGARRFLRDRFERNESIIFLASTASRAIGFTQLYPTFSSGSMRPILVLNDLYVAPEARGRGVGAALLTAAAGYGRQNGAARLSLQTELTNTTAQALYERMGWKRDTVFCTYQLAL